MQHYCNMLYIHLGKSKKARISHFKEVLINLDIK
jgi:hypothetical protein